MYYLEREFDLLVGFHARSDCVMGMAQGMAQQIPKLVFYIVLILPFGHGPSIHAVSLS